MSGLGNAYAGGAAVAEDATTVWSNPAGMARLAAGKHLSFGGAYIDPSTKFNDNGSVPAALSAPAGAEGGDAGRSKWVPNVFFATDLTPSWNFGVGVSVPFGLLTKYDPRWVGRFQGVTSEVETVNINPSVSYKLSDGASIGGGISYQQGSIDLTTAVNYSAIAFGAGGLPLLGAVGGPGVEGQNKTSLQGRAWGYNVGGLFNIGPRTRLGIHYRSSLEYTMRGDTSFSNRPAALAAGVPDSNVSLNLKTPDTVSFSVAQELGERWQLLADATRTHWSLIQQVPVVRSSGSQNGTTLDTLTFNFRNTWRLSAGANYRMTGGLVLKAGLAFDQTPVPNAETRSVRLPDADRTWYSLGATYGVSRNGKLDVGYSYVHVGNTDINNDQSAAGKGIVTGSYAAKIHVLGIQYQLTF